MLSAKDHIYLPATQMPVFRSSLAVQNGTHQNILFKTWGGLGDQICAEPTLRYAFKTFKNANISLASEQPELFSHLPFKRVFNLNEERPVYEKYFVLDTITTPDESNLVWQFFSHMLVNCVDFVSMCALRSQLPVADKEIKLSPTAPEEKELTSLIEKPSVFVHAGKHWESKTFPKDWWDAVLSHLIHDGVTPILIGANTDDNRGTVDVNTMGCLDLRNSISIMDCVWLLQRASVLLTNDSSPLHMAASGEAHIGFVATCKHPDYIMHWRKGQWAWRMQNLGVGGMWDITDQGPNTDQKITCDKIDEATLRTWLPSPRSVADWTQTRLHGLS